MVVGAPGRVSICGENSGYDVENEPPLQPDEPDDIGINLMQPQMIGPLILQQQPAPATAPFNFASFMCESGGDTTTFSSAVRKADAHLPPGPIHV